MSGDVDLVPLVEGKRSYLVMNEALLCVRSMEEEWACWSDMDFEPVAREMSGEDLHVVAGGMAHVCGLTRNGELRCFGYRSWDGRRLDDESGPIQRDYLEQGVVIPMPESDCCYQSLAIVGDRSCSLDAEGGAVCWGYIVPGGQEAPRVPLRTIALSRDEGCGVAADGEFHCWGFSFDGILDTGEVEIDDMQQISISPQMACGLDSAGVVSCWGRVAPSPHWREGFEGSLYEDPRDTPSTRFQWIEIGVAFVCGLTEADEVECWGDGNFGKLRSPPGRFRDFSVANHWACALSFEDEVHCWGSEGFYRPNWAEDAPVIWH